MLAWRLPYRLGMLIRDVISLQLGGLFALLKWAAARWLAGHGLSVPALVFLRAVGRPQEAVAIGGPGRGRRRCYLVCCSADRTSRSGCFAGNRWPMPRRGDIVAAHGASSGRRSSRPHRPGANIVRWPGRGDTSDQR